MTDAEILADFPELTIEDIRACLAFAGRFPGSCHVRDGGLAGQDDELIWRFARVTIVTKDNDFLARALVRVHPPQIVHICLGNVSTQQVATVLAAREDPIELFVAENKEPVLVLRG